MNFIHIINSKFFLHIIINYLLPKFVWEIENKLYFDKIKFLLDTTLGFINVNQNKIIKMFSVASVMFLPPTMVASIYGMNFEFMPELKWQQGYAFGLFLMFLSAVLPFLYFKRRGWL